MAAGLGHGRSSQFQPLDERVGYSKDGGVRGNFTIDFAPTLRAEWTSSLSLITQKWAPMGSGSRSVFTAPMQRGFRGAVQVDGEPAAGLHFSQGNHIDKRRQVLMGFNMSHIPTSYFDHRLSVGYDLNVVEAAHFHKVGHVMRPTGQLNQIDFEARTTTFDYGANLRTSLGGDISSTTSAGFQAYREFTRNTNFRVQDFPGPVAKPTLVAGALQTIRRDESLEVVNAGGYLQQVFGYKDYFFLTAGLRVDGNSAFGSGFGLQAYPKLSASYVVSDMAFWPSDWFESFKLRFAMGDAGKAPGGVRRRSELVLHRLGGRSGRVHAGGARGSGARSRAESRVRGGLRREPLRWTHHGGGHGVPADYVRCLDSQAGPSKLGLPRASVVERRDAAEPGG